MKNRPMKKKNTLLDLMVNYMFRNPYFKISFIPVFFLTHFAFKLHNNIIEYVVKQESYIVSNSVAESCETIILYYILFLFGHYLFTFMYGMLIEFFFNNNFTYSFGLYTEQYLMIKYSKFHSLGSGKIHSLIKRRSNAVTTLARIFMTHIYVGVAYAINNHVLIYKKFGLSVMLWNTLMYLSFGIFYYLVTPALKNIRDKTNECYNIVSNKIFGIVINYDLIKAYNNDEYEYKRLNKSLKDYEDSSLYFDAALSFSKYGQSILVFVCYSVAVFVALYGLGFERLANYEAISLYGKIFMTTIGKFESIGKNIPYFIEQSAVFEYTCLDDCDVEDLRNSELKTNFKDNIEFRDFSLTIDGSVLLRDVNFMVNKGEKVAIVGKNGCGKSSILKTLLRFVDYEGKVLIDGNDTQDMSTTSQRSMMAYIPQNPHIIEGTVLENIKYGNKEIRNEVLIDLCRSYKTHYIFKHFENGYSTNVGESGKFLSGGQKQQVSFMRAIVKDSDLYLVDEPTSNLDNKAEADMLNLIFNNMKEKTVLVILHNPKYLSMFDKILGIHNRGVNVYTSYNEFVKDEHLY